MKTLPNRIRHGGYLYVKMAATDDELLDELMEEFNSHYGAALDHMQTATEAGAAVPDLLEAFDPQVMAKLKESANGAFQAAKSLLAAHDLVRILFQAKDEAAKHPVHASTLPKRVRVAGRVYVAVEHPSEDMQPSSAAREYEVGVAHLKSIMQDATDVAMRARDLLGSLNQLKSQASEALTRHPDELQVDEVAALNPDYRVEHFKDPLRALQKSNRSLNYTVDAATTAIRVVLDQVDAMVDEWEARIDSMNAPHPSKELTKPMLLSDNPAAVFEELGGL
jgi:hypothetical protein